MAELEDDAQIVQTALDRGAVQRPIVAENNAAIGLFPVRPRAEGVQDLETGTVRIELEHRVGAVGAAGLGGTVERAIAALGELAVSEAAIHGGMEGVQHRVMIAIGVELEDAGIRSVMGEYHSG